MMLATNQRKPISGVLLLLSLLTSSLFANSAPIVNNLVAECTFLEMSIISEPIYTHVVDAEVTSSEVVKGTSQTNESEKLWYSDFPIDYLAYKPIPLLEPNENNKAPSDLGEQMVWYNVQTNKETILAELPYDLKQKLMMYRPKGSVGDATTSFPLEQNGGLQILNMSDLTKVTNPKDYPWRVNVLINSSLGRGSGVLIDPYWVLTAAHVIHEGGGGNYAQDLYVCPAVDSVNETNPYGTANAQGLIAWPGWTVYHDYNHDIGLIYLNRPVGAITGFHSYGYNDNCSFFTDNMFYIPGYPADGPYEDNMDMYYFYGTFSWCPTLNTNIVEFYRSCYGGQSGSGAHHLEGSERTVYAVLTTGSTLIPLTQCTQITSDKYAYIVDIIDSMTPSEFDLVPLFTKVEPQSINAGSQLSSMNYLVHNYSSATWSGTVDVEVYLSDDMKITTNDTLIQHHTFSATFSPKSNVLVNVTPPPTIPFSTPKRLYYIGVILKVSDSDTYNNTSSWQDIDKLWVDTKYCAVTASAGSHGTVDPSGTIYVKVGDRKTFCATPYSGYSVDKWYVNDQPQPGSEGLNSLTLDNVQEDTTVQVTFRISELIVERPATNPYETGRDDVMCNGTAPLNTHYVLWENITTDANGDTGELDGTTWGERIPLDQGSNTICFRAYDISDNLLASASIVVKRVNNIREASGRKLESCGIASGLPNKPLHGILYVGCDPTQYYCYNERGLVKLDGPSLPPGSTVVNATFGAKTTTGYHTGDGTMGLTVSRITGPWSADSVTWNSRPSYTTTGQTTENVPKVDDTLIWWDVTGIAQAWHTGSSNYGLFMISTSENIPYNLERVFDQDKFWIKINYSIETEVPQIQITSPTSGMSYTTGASSISLAGTASDGLYPYQVSRVDYINQTTGASGTASGTDSWSCTVPLAPGLNTISVIAYDASGNSDSDTITVFFLTPPVTVSASSDIMNHVLVRWDPVTDAGYYCVYRSQSETGTKSSISGWIDALSFLDTSAVPGVVYYYWVAASDDSSGTVQSDYAGPAIGKRPAPLDPELSGDHIVNSKDFALLASQWMEPCSGPNSCGGCDLDLSGKVGWSDVQIMADNWLKCSGMVLIPGGVFSMGDHFNEGDSDELPVHTVTVDSFYMGEFEVTNLDYCDYLNSAKSQGLIVVSSGVVYMYKPGSGTSYPYCDTSTSSPDSYIVYPARVGSVTVGTKGSIDMSDYPMVHVTWYGAVAYCNWRSQQEGYEQCYDLSTWDCDFSKNGYRLPTEAEWEYAARGGLSAKRFPWSPRGRGDTITHSQANYYSSSSYSYDVSPTRGYHPTWNDGVYPYTSPVGSFAPNGYGLYDMAGNVWEWCNDWYESDYYAGRPDPDVNPTGPAGPLDYRVRRGGGWNNYAHYCRVAHRYNINPASRRGDGGFRIVLDLN